MNDVVVSVKHLTKEVALAQGNTLKVLDDISFDVNQGVFVSIHPDQENRHCSTVFLVYYHLLKAKS